MAEERRTYEFSRDEDAVFRRLAGAMRFVAAAMLVPAAVLVLGPAYRLVTYGASIGQGLVAVLGLLLIVMAGNLFGAAAHFRRIATTEGHDIENLMVAVREVARAYAVQRWIWIAVGLVLILALATSVTAQ